MEIAKICTENGNENQFAGSTCINCQEDAEVVLTIGRTRIGLCLECAWNLSDLLDETTRINFVKAERK